MKITNKPNLKVFAIGAMCLAMAIFSPILADGKDLSVTNIEVAEIKNNSAAIQWQTSGAKTTGIVYLGENGNDFNRTLKDGNFSYSHKVVVSNLEKGKTYFYKIVVADKEGETRDIFVRNFSTKGMPDAVKPKILDAQVVQSAYGAVVIRWATNEETAAVIEYGVDANKLDKKISVNNFTKENEAVIRNLQNDRRYYIEITVLDRDKNSSSKTLTATVSGRQGDSVLKIYDLSPIYFDKSIISARSAKISFKTNLAAKSRVYYGTDYKNLKNKVDVSKNLSVRHEINVENLDPNTIYFFTVEAYGSIYAKTIKSDLFSFETGDVQARYPSGSLVRAKGDYKVYVICRDGKTWIENGEAFSKLGYKSSWVREVDPATLRDYKDIKNISSAKVHPDGTLIKYSDKAAVYFIEGGLKRPVGSVDAFNRNGFNWSWIMNAPKSEKYKDGTYIS